MYLTHTRSRALELKASNSIGNTKAIARDDRRIVLLRFQHFYSPHWTFFEYMLIRLLIEIKRLDA